MKARHGVWVLIAASMAFCLSLISSPVSAAASKDVIVVLDTSLTMEGYGGGKKIFEDVKNSIKNFVDKEVKDGDTFTFISFDETVKVYPTVRIDDINDRNIVKGYIAMTEAHGKWTFTAKMLYEAFSKAEKLQDNSKSKGREALLVIMTDGIDDPPPGSPKHMNISEVTKAFAGKDNWWIHYISYVDFKKNKAALDKLKQQFEGVTGEDKTKIKKGEPGGNEKIDPDINRKPQKSYLIPILIAVGALVLLGLILLIIFKILSSIVVKGKLEYWSNEVIEPYIITYDLARRPEREVRIGKGPGCLIFIRDIDVPSPVSIRACRVKGQIKMQILSPEGVNVEMVNREGGAFLEDGDMFKINNYTFKYFAPQQ